MPYRPDARASTGTDRKPPPRPNTSNSRTGRPLGGRDDGQLAKPTKHSAGNNATTSHADTPQPDEPGQNRPDGKRTAYGTTYSNPTRPARPIRTMAQHRTSRPVASGQFSKHLHIRCFWSSAPAQVVPCSFMPVITRVNQVAAYQVCSHPASVSPVDHVLHGICPNVMTLGSQQRALAFESRGR